MSGTEPVSGGGSGGGSCGAGGLPPSGGGAAPPPSSGGGGGGGGGGVPPPSAPGSGGGARLRGGSNATEATEAGAAATAQATTPAASGAVASGGGGGANPPSPQAARSAKPCCFCWCCCCSCSCLAGKAGEEASKSNPDGELPSLEEIRSWGKSFDKLMRSAAGRKVFRDFLRCEYSEENILFWLACEELKKESNPDVVEEKARYIYEDYISILSPKEVSLDSRVREIVNRNMVDPTPHTFDEAQLQIYTLMHRDSYPRFVNSPLFKQLAQLNNSAGGGNGNGAGSQAQSPTRRESSA